MTNNILISILIHKEVLTEDEGKHIAKQLESGIIPTDFDFAKRHVEGIFKSYDRSQKGKKAIAKPEGV